MIERDLRFETNVTIDEGSMTNSTALITTSVWIILTTRQLNIKELHPAWVTFNAPGAAHLLKQAASRLKTKSKSKEANHR